MTQLGDHRIRLAATRSRARTPIRPRPLRAPLRVAANRGVAIACALLALGVVGCSPGYEKGVNKDLDKPVHADQQPEKNDKK
jgi:hypothetical protein